MTENEKELLHRIEKLEEYVEHLLDVHMRHINLNLSAILLMAQKQGVDPEQLFDDAKRVQAVANVICKEVMGEVDE